MEAVTETINTSTTLVNIYYNHTKNAKKLLQLKSINYYHLILDERRSILRAGFNSLLTDSSLLDRSLPDLGRSSVLWQLITCFSSCKVKSYHRTLRNVSIVIIYHNDLAEKSLQFNKTNYLLDEIILVDDFNDTSIDIENYLANQLMHEAKVLHLKERQGLIRACIEGQVKVLVFLIAPIKANEDWLPP
uniref:Glycosyltransferase 2-like domain-containing protein n=1 Tax=Glossina pallidipes TaxID=7398 RepID=A0A1B0AC91_GLOPL